MKPRMMYIEDKSGGLNGVGRIGRVTYSKTGKTVYYGGREFRSLKGGYKANFYDVEFGDEFWITGPKKQGRDRLYGTGGSEIDEDVRVEYWSVVRERPDLSARTKT